MLELALLEHEEFYCIFLDNQHRVLKVECCFQGTIDGANVYPREVVKRALHLNAKALILAHNHPSGLAEPSEADRAITRRLIDALSLVDMRVLDHFIIGGAECFSFAEQGLL
jgi:DNA repair protein RadC